MPRDEVSLTLFHSTLVRLLYYSILYQPEFPTHITLSDLSVSDDDPKLPELNELVRSGNCVAFVGSGLSSDLYPSWPCLISKLCDACGVEYDVIDENTDPEKLLDFADEALNVDADAYCRILAQEFAHPIDKEKAAYDRLMRAPFKCYVTINFDPLLANERRKPERKLGEVYIPPHLSAQDIGHRNLFYIHGLIEIGKIPEVNQIILGRNHFQSAYDEDESTLPHFLKELFTFNHIAFLGCTLREYTLKRIFEYSQKVQSKISDRFPEIELKRKYILLPKRYVNDKEEETIHRDKRTEEEEIRRADEYGVHIVRYEPKDESHSGLMEILEEWGNLLPFEIGPQLDERLK